MPTPPKPYLVLTKEKNSHRTKAELRQRELGEAALVTGTALKERPEVKANPLAHKEFRRLNKLLKSIDKNDAIYEGIINRYCIIHAECHEMAERREEFYNTLKTLREKAKELTADINVDERTMIMIEMARELGKISNAINNIDKLLLTKRKMLLDIEKENIMTIASALRSIPKKPDTKKNALLEALGQ